MTWRLTRRCAWRRTCLDKVDTFSKRREVSNGRTARPEEVVSIQRGVQAHGGAAQRDAGQGGAKPYATNQRVRINYPVQGASPPPVLQHRESWHLRACALAR